MSLRAAVGENPFLSTIYRNSPKAQVSINYSFLKIKASVLVERPGVHVQPRVAAAAAMINLQLLNNDALIRLLK
ncbi:MAG: hypothetical protein WBV91_15155, partial [Desulfobacterales bacterium]